MFTKLLLAVVLLQPPTITKHLLPGKISRRDTTNNYIVIHNDGAGMNEKSTRLVLRMRRLSYHFFINKDGKIFQFKELRNVAYHAGSTDYLGMKNWNTFSIGICLQGSDDTQYTDKQYESLSTLINYLYRKYPDSREKQIVTHAQVASPYGRKTDPGNFFDISKLSLNKDGV
jgi:hypothetical protein